MITPCRICGHLYETTTEDANIPNFAAGPKDRICHACHVKNPAGYTVRGDPI